MPTPDPGRVDTMKEPRRLVECDYSSLELRIMATAPDPSIYSSRRPPRGHLAEQREQIAALVRRLGQMPWSRPCQ